MSFQKKQALVIGGSIAGLVVTRVLLRHFEQVTLIERDMYPHDPVSRPGIPQGRQLHTTLLRGQQALEHLFPGLTARLLAGGAVERDYGNESLYYYGGGRCPRIPPFLHGWNCSRLLLEWQIRQELAKSAQLKILEGHEVVHLLYDKSINHVKGVQFRLRTHLASNEVESLQADLVIDASGSSSRTPQWLQELGCDIPSEEIVTANLGYATCFYENLETPWRGIAIQATGQPRRGGVLMEIEHGKWMVVLSGINGDYPPTHSQEFLAFAKALPDLALYDAMKSAMPSSKIYGYRYAENRLRHFEQLRRQPEGFIVVGDAVCNFNPLYGQGMTVAALEALALDACLQKRDMQKGFAHAFQKEVSHLLVVPWMLATAADARASRAKGSWYMERFLALLPKDSGALITFLEVMHMLRHPIALLHPAIIMKVITSR